VNTTQLASLCIEVDRGRVRDRRRRESQRTSCCCSSRGGEVVEGGAVPKARSGAVVLRRAPDREAEWHCREGGKAEVVEANRRPTPGHEAAASKRCPRSERTLRRAHIVGDAHSEDEAVWTRGLSIVTPSSDLRRGAAALRVSASYERPGRSRKHGSSASTRNDRAAGTVLHARPCCAARSARADASVLKAIKLCSALGIPPSWKRYADVLI